ncbi:MAG TPA: methyltransferase domain-containing protein [Terrimicrobiaceae bacterium]|nr:methyltransferase domain-containing protein [Terrimicrobiaceae bacterium]
MSHYLHGSDPAEQSRLSKLNDLINARCLPKLQIESGFRVLDVGSGLGQLTYRMSEAVGPHGYCLGIERDTNQLSVAKKNHVAPNLEFRQGDALSLPLRSHEFESFDFTHARFLLEHLSDPARAVSEMVKSLKPGGRIFLADDDHQSLRLFPEAIGFQALWSAYMDSYVDVGNDPLIGRKLAKLLVDQGIRNVRNDVVFFGDCAGTETFPLFVDNLIGVISTSYRVMITSKLISDSEYQSAIRSVKDWSSLPHAAIWYTICVAEGIRR